jgi:surface protein
MDYLFEDTNFDGNISEWNTSKVTSMYNMFCACNFNGDISKWDVSNVTDMDEMFDSSYFEGDISSWKINDCCTISDMFKGTKILLIHIPKDILVHLDARDITKW